MKDRPTAPARRRVPPRGCKSSLKCYHANPKSSVKRDQDHTGGLGSLLGQGWPQKAFAGVSLAQQLFNPNPHTPRSLPAGGGALDNPTKWQRQFLGAAAL